jgi:hypothetical protein
MAQIVRVLPVLVTLAWGLWFGGVLAVFLAVTSLFDTFAPDRALAGTAAAGVFRRFEFYQLVLAAAAVVAAAVWRLSAPAAPRRLTALLVLLALAAGTAGTSTFAISRRIETLRGQKQTTTPEFRRLHGVSMALYTAEALVLLGAGVVLPGALRSGRASVVSRHDTDAS